MLRKPDVFDYQFLAYLREGFHSNVHAFMVTPASTSSHVHGASDAVWMRSLQTQDASEQAQAQEGWNLQYEQISAGNFRGKLDMMHLPGLSLIHESANQSIRQQGDLSHDSCLFAFVAHPMGEHAIYAGQCAQSHQVLVGHGTDLDLMCPSGFALMGMVVDTELLLSLWHATRASEAPPWLQQRHVLSLGHAQSVQLQKRLRDMLINADAFMQSGHPQQTSGLTMLRDQILLEWLDHIPLETQPTPVTHLIERKQLVDKACELMIELHHGEALSLVEICRLIGVSHRKLSYCFQDILGMSPMRYQRTARLNRVRWSLQRAHDGESVQNIAMQWGFWHMGQFGQDYKRHFGEAPSVTLRAGLKSTTPV